MFLLISLSSLLALFFVAECVMPVFAGLHPRRGPVARKANGRPRELPATQRKAARQAGFPFDRRRKTWASAASRKATRSREVKVA